VVPRKNIGIYTLIITIKVVDMRSLFAVACVSLLLVAGLAVADIVDERGQKTVEWTFLVYMDADNNLEGAGIEDLNEMEIAGSTDQVNIVVQFDRAQNYDTSNGDWTGTKRYLVQEDSHNSEIVSDELEDMGEMNMGDPKTLSDFVIWGIDEFPARKYAVILWNHGGAFWGIAWDDDINGSDEHDWLSMEDLEIAFNDIEDHLGRNIDLVGFDACLMANVAVLYQIMDHVDIGVGSGYTEPGEGWPYEMILPRLNENPNMEPADLGRIISDEYVDSYSDREGDPDDTTAITMAAFDLNKFGELGHQLDMMGMVLALNSDIRPLKGHWLRIQQARSDTNSYDFPGQFAPGNQIPIDAGGYCNYDVIDLMDNIQKYIPGDSQIMDQAEAVKKATRDATVHYRATGYTEAVKGAHGLTLYFPSGTDNDYSDTYDTLEFANETYWDEFLHFYMGKSSATDTPPSVIIESPEDGEVYRPDWGNFAVTGKAYDIQGNTATTEYRVDGGEWMTASGSHDWSFVLDTKTLGEGVHDIEVRSSDGSSESSVHHIQVKVFRPEKDGNEQAPYDDGKNYMLAGVAFIALVVIGFIALGRWRRRR
jgi:hypothetical protein